MSVLGKLKKLIRSLHKNAKTMYRSGWEEGSTAPVTSMESWSGDENVLINKTRPIDEREEKKPIEVVSSILTDEPKMNLDTLGMQIKTVEKRLRMLKALNVSRQDETEALAFLKARKKYKKCKDKFKWAITTFAKIDELKKKYKVKLASIEGYYKNLPNEALEEFEKFISAYEEVRDDRPVAKLIVDDGGPETKKDPILLVSSPFGKWFYVLGAWDKEIEYVDDLIYNGK